MRWQIRAFISQCEADRQSIAVQAEVKQIGFLIHHSLMPVVLKNGNDNPRRRISMHFIGGKVQDPPMLKTLPEGAHPFCGVERRKEDIGILSDFDLLAYERDGF